MDGSQTVKAKSRGLIMLKVCFRILSSPSFSTAFFFTHTLSLLPRNRLGPARDFITAIDQWYPTWPTSVEDRAMIV